MNISHFMNILCWLGLVLGSIRASPNLDIPGIKFDSKAHLRRPCARYCASSLSENWHFEVGEACLCCYMCIASLLLCICPLNPRLLFSGVGVSCWMSPFRCGGSLLNVSSPVWGWAAECLLSSVGVSCWMSPLQCGG